MIHYYPSQSGGAGVIYPKNHISCSIARFIISSYFYDSCTFCSSKNVASNKAFLLFKCKIYIYIYFL